MAIDLYSKSATDTLLAAKLSISSLSNGAATNIDPTAPTNGQVLGYSDATSSLVWLSAGGGGSYLPLAGGAMDTGAVITIANSTTDIRYGSDYIGLNLTASSGSTGATFDYNGISIFDGTNNSNINPTQMLVQDATQSTTIVPASVAVNNGTTSMTMTATGLTFPDSTTQSTAASPFTGGSVASAITIDNGTYYSVFAPNAFISVLSADSSQTANLQYDGVRVANGFGTTYVGPTGITFPDSTVQTTAASPDWFAMNYAGICSALAVNLTSISNNVLTFNVGSAFLSINVMNGGNIGITQDATNFYAFDTVVSAGVFQASTFSLDTGNYAYLAFKDSGGTWHWCPNAAVFSP